VDANGNREFIIYNMAGHVSPEDPAGIYYALSKISGPNPELPVNLEVFGKLLCKMAELYIVKRHDSKTTQKRRAREQQNLIKI
jgi:hypothetical protein